MDNVDRVGARTGFVGSRPSEWALEDLGEQARKRSLRVSGTFAAFLPF